MSLYANLVAAVTYADKDPPRKHVALDEARKDFESLAAFPESGWARLIRYRYFEFTNQEDAAFQEMSEAVSLVKGPWPRTYYALGLYRRGEFQQALGELAKLEEENELGAFQATMRMYILAELLAEQLPDRREKALQAYREELRRHHGTTLLFQLTAFYLWGRKAEAVAAYQQIPPDTLPRLRGDSYRQLLKYNCDPRMTADELLATNEDSRYHRCNAQFFIAMSLLAQGDKQGAREHFRRCVDTGVFDFDAYDWSRTFLARMACEPDWPRWIPAHQP